MTYRLSALQTTKLVKLTVILLLQLTVTHLNSFWFETCLGLAFVCLFFEPKTFFSKEHVSEGNGAFLVYPYVKGTKLIFLKEMLYIEKLNTFKS